MAEVQATENVPGPLLNSATSPIQIATETATLSSNDAGLTPSSTRAFLDVAAAAVHPVFGSEVVYSNGRLGEHGSPRMDSRSRDNSAERNQGGVNTPCGIMKVSFFPSVLFVVSNSAMGANGGQHCRISYTYVFYRAQTKFGTQLCCRVIGSLNL